MKKLFPLLLVLWFGQTHAQHSIEEQVGQFAQAIPAYYFGYTQVFFENSGGPMVLSNQMQHWDKDWRVKYGLGFSSHAFNTSSSQISSIDRSVLPQSESIQYMGSMNNVFGPDDGSTIRQYLLDADGERIVNPISGEFIHFELEMPGGFSPGLGVVPYTNALFEIRPWKGISFSAGWAPLGYLMREFEEGDFTIRSNMVSAGISIHMRHFSMAPVLSWFRFDASYNQLSLNMKHLEDVMTLTSDHAFGIDFKNLGMTTQLSSVQYRASIMIPTFKKVFILLQGGALSHSYDFAFQYEADVTIDPESISDEYNMELNDATFKIDNEFKASDSYQDQLYYSGGLFFEGKIASLYLGYAEINHPTFALKTTLKIL